MWAIVKKKKKSLFKSLYFDSGNVEAILCVSLTCYRINDAMFCSHSKNGFYTIGSSYYVARIITIIETLIYSSNGAYATVVKNLEVYTVFGKLSSHSHNLQLTILNSIHNSLFFLNLTLILVWNPNLNSVFGL